MNLCNHLWASLRVALAVATLLVGAACDDDGHGA